MEFSTKPCTKCGIECTDCGWWPTEGEMLCMSCGFKIISEKSNKSKPKEEEKKVDKAPRDIEQFLSAAMTLMASGVPIEDLNELIKSVDKCTNPRGAVIKLRKDLIPLLDKESALPN